MENAAGNDENDSNNLFKKIFKQYIEKKIE